MSSIANVLPYAGLRLNSCLLEEATRLCCVVYVRISVTPAHGNVKCMMWTIVRSALKSARPALKNAGRWQNSMFDLKKGSKLVIDQMAAGIY
ncbi:hypothetical protein [Chryseolinea sp. H1M3-3]|uniref:hypothetical protein n=1 Tax=Chryseolinea sp. H1M3-3 TaxID=3034144 RepID=UPI003208E9D3